MWLLRNPKSPFYSQAGRSSNERWLNAKDVARDFQNAGFFSSAPIGVRCVPYRLATFCSKEESPPLWARMALRLWNFGEAFVWLLPSCPFALSSWMVLKHQKMVGSRGI